MYIITNKNGNAVFNGYLPSGNINWVQLDDLKKDNEFQICVFKNPEGIISELDRREIPVKGCAVLLDNLIFQLTKVTQ